MFRTTHKTGDKHTPIAGWIIHVTIVGGISTTASLICPGRALSLPAGGTSEELRGYKGK